MPCCRVSLCRAAHLVTSTSFPCLRFLVSNALVPFRVSRAAYVCVSVARLSAGNAWHVLHGMSGDAWHLLHMSQCMCYSVGCPFNGVCIAWGVHSIRCGVCIAWGVG